MQGRDGNHAGRLVICQPGFRHTCCKASTGEPDAGRMGRSVMPPDSAPNGPTCARREGQPTHAADVPALVLDVFLGVLIVASLAIAVTALWIGPRRIFYAASCHALIDLCVLWRLRRGPFENGPLVVAIALWAVVSYAAFLGRGTSDIGMVVLGILMMVAALLRATWQRWLMMLLTLAVIWAMGVGEITGRYHHRLSHLTYWDDLIILSIIFAASAALMRTMVRRLAESLLVANASLHNYKEIFNATNEAIVVLDGQNGYVLDANQAALAMLAEGTGGRDLIGQSVAQPMGLSASELQTWLAQCARGETLAEERPLAMGQAKAFWCELSLRSAVIDGQQRVLAVVRDVDARHRLQEELRQADKLRALGHLAGGVAHDFNNQLTGILANAELIKLEVQSRRPVSELFVDAIIKCALRSADLTRQLLAFARKARPKREEVDVQGLVNDVTEMLKRGLHPGVAVHVQASAKNLLTAGDPSLLHNALLNLGINGQEAMPKGGRLSFETSLVSLAEPQAKALDLNPGAYVLVRVQDTGMGMDESVRAQIFDPFFTTKDAGTGMGLAAAYGTVRSHGGALTVASELRQGSTFSVYLPAASALTRSKSETGLPAFPQAATKLQVMVVDDEPDVAQTTAHMLAAVGHHPHVYNCPHAALQAYVQAPLAFDLAVIDRIMPEVSGDQLLLQLRSHKANLPSVIISGYSDLDVPLKTGSGKTVFLPKPFGPHDLNGAIVSVLSSPVNRS